MSRKVKDYLSLYKREISFLFFSLAVNVILRFYKLARLGYGATTKLSIIWFAMILSVRLIRQYFLPTG